MSNTTFIYTLNDPKTGCIRYVGKSDNPFKRFVGHLADTKRQVHRTNWIRSLKADGLKPTCDLLDEVPSAEWEFWEREYIRVFKAIGMRLVNTSPGGEGVALTLNGRERIRLSRLGKHLSAETKAKLRAANLGKKLSPEAAARLRAGRLGKKLSADHKSKIRISQKKRIFTPQEKARLAMLAKTQSAETRAKAAASRRGLKMSAQTKLKMSLAKLGKGKSPETRARMSAAQRHRRCKYQLTLGF